MLAKFKKPFIVTALLILGNLLSPAAVIPLSRDLIAGPHAVGFRVSKQFDGTREFKRAIDVDGGRMLGDRSRPMLMGVWYPCQRPSSSQAMPFERYLKMAPMDFMVSSNSLRPAEELMAWLGENARKEHATRTFMTPTSAFAEAVPTPGRFPVVLYAPSLNAPLFENSVLCEYLASHGFIVIASPCMGARSRYMAPGKYEDFDSQARDIEYLLAFARNLPNAASEDVAVVGYSIGGLSNFLAALRSDQIQALVCLDGTITGYYPQIKDRPYLSEISKLGQPVLFTCSSEKFLEKFPEYKPGMTRAFITEIPFMDVAWVEFRRLSHSNFSSLFNHLWKRDTENGEASDEVVLEDYSLMCRYVLGFLVSWDQPNRRSGRESDPLWDEEKLDPSVVFTLRRAARPSPPTILEFARQVKKAGYDKALEVYAAAKARDPEFKLSEGKLNSWAYHLLSRDQTNEAIAGFRLSLSLYPESNNAYNGLGEAYAKMGDHQRAEEQYRKSVAVNPNNDAGKQAKKKLEK